MNPLDLLQFCLLKLLHELEGTGITLTVGGGYGLVLKRQQIIDNASPTLLAMPPQLRSTNDLDLFLQIELLASVDKARLFAEALERLDFKPVETAKYYQFIRLFGEDIGQRTVKIDLLAGPPEHSNGLRLEDDRRIKPRDKTIALHARRTDEAVAIEENGIHFTVRGLRLNESEAEGVVYLPNVFSYLLMKLHAFQDKEERGNSENAGKHAADLYQILALTTEQDWETAKHLRSQHSR